MIIKFEYKTTYADYTSFDGSIIELPDPISPGPSWEMCGSAAIPGRFFWFWKKGVK